VSELLRRYGTVLALGLLVIALALMAPNFSSPINLLNILKQVSYLTIIATGFTLALVGGELDLSIGAVATLASVVCAVLLFGGSAWPLAVAAGLLTGAGLGLVNGVCVVRFRIPSLIATLATATIAGGIAFMITGGVAFVGRLPAGFLFIGRGSILSVPMPVVWMLALLLLAGLWLSMSRSGSHLIASGEAPEAARLAGVAVGRMKALGLVLSGAAAGAAGILLTSALSSSSPTIAGDFLMKGIAAVLLGMTTIEPGKPNLAGTFVGVLIIGTLANGLTLLGSEYYVQDILLGLIILASVGISASRLSNAAFGGTR
jgi:ribose transport system permease protein